MAQPPTNHVKLTVCRALKPEDDTPLLLILNIPVPVIGTLTLRPFKWLRFLGFVILGLDGFLSETEDGGPISDIVMGSEALPDRDIALWYRLSATTTFTLAAAVNPRLRHRSPSTSRSQSRKSDFRDSLMNAHGRKCLFTSEPELVSDAAHLVAFRYGDQCLQDILTRRAHTDDTISPEMTHVGLNSVHNGYFLRTDLHRLIDSGTCAILFTPNKYLGVSDVPFQQSYRTEEQLRSLQYRLTLQDFNPAFRLFNHLPSDAIFSDTTSVTDYPHPGLLHWMYGLAAVMTWAEKNECYHYLYEHPDTITAEIPPDPPPTPRDPERTPQSREGNDAANRAWRSGGVQASSSGAGSQRMNVMFGIMNKMAHIPDLVSHDLTADRGAGEERVSRWSKHQRSLAASVGSHKQDQQSVY